MAASVQPLYEGWFKSVTLTCNDWNFGIIFQHNPSPPNVYKLLPAMLKDHNATLNEGIFFIVQKVLHCIYDVIIWIKERVTKMSFSNFRNNWKSVGAR